MRYVDNSRSAGVCRRMADRINQLAEGRVFKIMEVCGTHTVSIRRCGLPSLLSKNIRLLSGPGCPVCVTSEAYLRNALKFCANKNVTCATYADMLRVPVDETSLEKEKSRGADIRSVTSALDCLELCRRLPGRQVVFLAVGFETTAPATALLAKAAFQKKIKNLKIYSGHKTIPEALLILGKDKDLFLDGFLLPGHVSVITGLSVYRPIVQKTRLPAVVAGFEPLDMLDAIYRIVQASVLKKPVLENAYTRVVSQKGNLRAQRLLKDVFVSRDSVWRGLGLIPQSGLFLKSRFSSLDAIPVFGLKETVSRKASAVCLCAEVLKGKVEPGQCSSFGRSCLPSSPQGPCMVSREGSCRAHYESLQVSEQVAVS